MASLYTQQKNNSFKTWILITLFIGFVSAITYIFAITTNNPSIAWIGLAMSIGQSLIGYFAGGQIAIASAGGKEVSYDQAPQIHEMVENLSKIADIPKPKIYISPDPSANAFACGRNPKNARICLNQGLLNLLNKNELEGVIAHELSHIKNRDILIMTVTMILSSVISFLADFGLRSMMWGNRRSDDDDEVNPIFIVLFIASIVLAPLLSIVIQMAISRSREFQADAGAVELTRYPNGLISALEKLYNSPTPTKNYSTAMNHFYISPSKKKFGEKVTGLFNTHPTVEQRVAALKQMG